MSNSLVSESGYATCATFVVQGKFNARLSLCVTVWPCAKLMRALNGVEDTSMPEQPLPLTSVACSLQHLQSKVGQAPNAQNNRKRAQASACQRSQPWCASPPAEKLFDVLRDAIIHPTMCKLQRPTTPTLSAREPFAVLTITVCPSSSRGSRPVNPVA